MKAHVLIGIVLFSGNVIAQSQAVFPARLQLSNAVTEVVQGNVARYSVTLKNDSNESVAAPRDIQIEVVSQQLGKPLTVIIPQGKTSAEFKIIAPTVGISKVEANARQLVRGMGLLVVRPARQPTGRPIQLRPERQPQRSPAGKSRTLEMPNRARQNTHSSAGMLAIPPEAAATMASPTGGMLGASPVSSTPAATVALLPTKLLLWVQPEPVPLDAIGREARASIGIITTTDNGQLASVPSDMAVELSAARGTLSTRHVTIPIGHSSNSGSEVMLVSHTTGPEHLEAVSPLQPAEVDFLYNLPIPVQLRIQAAPAWVVNDGRSIVQLNVCLLDAANWETYYEDRDLPVDLISSIGTIDPKPVQIAKGRSCQIENLTSSQHGWATITASAPGFAQVSTRVQFRFPWLLISMAAFGALLGGVVRNPGNLVAGESLLRAWGQTLAIALIFGVVFYLAAYFGVLTLLPEKKLPIAVEKVPTINELGAFLIGFIGGLLGRTYWTPDGQEVGIGHAVGK